MMATTTPTLGVYMMLDRHDAVLYVGASRNLERRVQEHHTKDWWPLVATVETYPMSSWPQALDVEKRLIARFAPQGNQQSNDSAARAYSFVRGSLTREFA